LVKRLRSLGIRFAAEPTSTFYGWACLGELPPPFDDAMTFFRRALDRKVMTVPGEFFDVNPGKRRRGESPYRRWMRFSFGPPIDNLAMGLDRLEEMLASAPKARPRRAHRPVA
jgi:aspartate/methionine/tyrosine aminotransferase